MNWRDIGKRSVPVDIPMQFVALLIALAWITHGHVLGMQSVIRMALPLSLRSTGIGEAMHAVDGQACPVCLTATAPASPLSVFGNSGHDGIQKLLFASFRAGEVLSGAYWPDKRRARLINADSFLPMA